MVFKTEDQAQQLDVLIYGCVGGAVGESTDSRLIARHFHHVHFVAFIVLELDENVGAVQNVKDFEGVAVGGCRRVSWFELLPWQQ